MAGKIRRYRSDEIDVTYDARRCIHAAECVRRLPAVFDTGKRPWVQPANAGADAVAKVVARCPTGALQAERADGSAAEALPSANRILVAADGPLYLRADVRLEVGDGTLAETRLALCRCGQSANKPFCDNTHKKARFADGGQIGETGAEEMEPDGRLTVTPAADGPLLVRGRFELVSADGETVYRGDKAALCRCGGSSNKPFCDGSHRQNDFSAEGSQ